MLGVGMGGSSRCQCCGGGISSSLGCVALCRITRCNPLNKKNLTSNRKQEVTVVSEEASHRQLFFNLCNIQILLILCVGACVLVYVCLCSYVFLSLRHSAMSEQLLKSCWGWWTWLKFNSAFKQQQKKVFYSR